MVKATFKGKREPMELEGDMILGTTIQYDAIRDSGAFIIGDVKFSILPLRPDWHNMTPYSVHMNQEFDESLKRRAQEYYEAHIGTREQFIAEFGKSYL